MPSAAPTSRKPLKLGLSPEKGNEIAGLVLGTVVLLLLGSLLTYHPLDPSVLYQPAEDGASVHNLVGPFGAHLAGLLLALMGVPALLLPLLLGLIAYRRFIGRSESSWGGRLLGLAGVMAALPALLHLLVGTMSWRGRPLATGGGLGAAVGDLLAERLNVGGAVLVLLAVLLVGGTLVVQTTLGDLLRQARVRLLALLDHLRLRWTQRRERSKKESVRRRVVARQAARAQEARGGQSEAPPVRKEAPAPAAESKVDLPMRVVTRPGEGRFAVRKVAASEAASSVAPNPAPEQAKAKAAAKKPPATNDLQQERIDFGSDEPLVGELPPVNLLRCDAIASTHKESELVRQAEVLRASCEEFGVQGSIEGINPGPVITTFEMQPAPGVKVSRIVGLQDDLALALKAESVRIDRMPGRSTLGVEVPNAKRSIIPLGGLLSDTTFQKSPSVLTMAIGSDIHGRPYYSDLATMPHLLVAGATGAGKSVGLQSMITSVLYKATREQVQFIFIDPKRIELGVYADIPHLKCEVVVEPKKAANALRWAVSEMERRYRLLAEVHVRSIDYYNRAIRDPKERQRLSLKEGESEFRPEDFQPLPYYVVVIDELADLMMVAASDVETSIARLAQMARAVGIHLIVATQRPSVDVLTGTIKANFPCRLAYATATRHDSRTILDQVGAEKLLGKGDALFMPPGTSRIQRLHGAYISEQETAALIRWLKRRGRPDLDPSVLEAPEEERSSSGGSSGGDGDDLYDEAARLVVAERMASASFLQRRMRVGFSRAARLIDMMESDGLLGPAQGSKPREVLVPPDYFEEIDQARALEP